MDTPNQQNRNQKLIDFKNDITLNHLNLKQMVSDLKADVDTIKNDVCYIKMILTSIKDLNTKPKEPISKGWFF
tara:strand:- start:148 stop:366 length:219 start_codon:yes stop_codon:yes gene_type:complete